MMSLLNSFGKATVTFDLVNDRVDVDLPEGTVVRISKKDSDNE
jgi:hypothetical protein